MNMLKQTMVTSGTFYLKDYWGGALVPCALLPSGYASKFQFYLSKKPRKTYINDMYFLKLAFTPRKDGQLLKNKKLQEKEL